MDANVAKKILRTYFEGKATPVQKRMLLEWLKDSSSEASSREVFYEVLHEWEKAQPQMLPDPEADWQAIRARLDRQEDATARPLVPREPVRHQRRYLWAAASVVLLVLVGWWQQERLLFKTYVSGYGETRTIVLSDGSRVTLNADSRLTFPRFAALGSAREARLRGEAEFSVVHTRDHRPFLVRTPDDLEVRVLGTEFVVYGREQASQVILTKGKVQLRSLKTSLPPVELKPGEMASIDPEGEVVLTEPEEIAHLLAWKEHRFVFDRTPLSEIARQIRERFGVEVLIPDSTLASRQLSGNYPAENADEVILMITRILSVRSEKVSDKKVLVFSDN